MMNDNNDGWVRCPHCKHKLFRETGGVDFVPEFSDTPADMQIKCHSCKNIISFVVVKEKHSGYDA